MGNTITEKILAAHAGLDRVEPGDFIQAQTDLVMSNDATGYISIQEFREAGVQKVFDPDKIALVPSHFVPNNDIQSAIQALLLKEFAHEHQINHYWEVGEMGIEHALLPEEGIIAPGEVIVGGDSHTCTYGALGAFSTGLGSTDIAAAFALGEVWLKVPESMKVIFKGKAHPYVTGKDLILYLIGQIGVDGALYKSLELCGETIDCLPVEERMTVCNMAIEAGAKNGIIAPDSLTLDYIQDRVKKPYTAYYSDSDAEYDNTYTFDAGNIYPLVAKPYSPANVVPAEDVKGVKINQVVIGSCTNGRISDLRQAASIFAKNRVAKGVKVIIIPATQKVFLQAIREGLMEIFITAGAAVTTPTCGPCAGLHTGVIGPGEVVVSTTNRNFTGRMGHPQGKVYLSSPYVAAASAVTGEITAPEEVF